MLECERKKYGTKGVQLRINWKGLGIYEHTKDELNFDRGFADELDSAAGKIGKGNERKKIGNCGFERQGKKDKSFRKRSE